MVLVSIRSGEKKSVHVIKLCANEKAYRWRWQRQEIINEIINYYNLVYKLQKFKVGESFGFLSNI